uniref:Uncharacterized protein n=1 Tax=Panstrongylus lignarius TaxID=156445 RepID=A0A224XSH8_9HEMI
MSAYVVVLWVSTPSYTFSMHSNPFPLRRSMIRLFYSVVTASNEEHVMCWCFDLSATSATEGSNILSRHTGIWHHFFQVYIFP